jgi:hypothetical protein
MMRTTLDIDDDILEAAKEIARRDHSSAGRVLSKLARRGLTVASAAEEAPLVRNGVPLLPRRGELITSEYVQRLLDEE